jgi:DNA-binding transcriptional LysR family regulator
MPAPAPNLHHLELFHHVARCGGISAAVRAMPYGIQQPAVSGQIRQLEADLGVELFRRRPFRLSEAGRELADFLAPFFRDLPGVAERVAGRANRQLRLAAPSSVIRDFLPAILGKVRSEFPDLEISLVALRHNEMIERLEDGGLDLAIIELEGRPPRGMGVEILVRLPFVLWLPPGMQIPRGGVKALASAHPLLRPPDDTVMARICNKVWTRRGIHWPARMELGTADLILEYVTRGFGVGLGHWLPGPLPPSIGVLPLKDVPPLVIAAMWTGRASPPVRATVQQLRQVAGTLAARQR